MGVTQQVPLSGLQPCGDSTVASAIAENGEVVGPAVSCIRGWEGPGRGCGGFFLEFPEHSLLGSDGESAGQGC